MAKKPKNRVKQHPKIKKRNPLVTAGIVVIVLALLIFFGLNLIGTNQQPVMAKKANWEVVNSYPHDPKAFLQGLVWYNNSFYESTGLHGYSSLRHVEFPSGKVLQKIDIPQEFFAEGLA